jgi:hypothetical protein
MVTSTTLGSWKPAACNPSIGVRQSTHMRAVKSFLPLVNAASAAAATRRAGPVLAALRAAGPAAAHADGLIGC